LCLFIDTTKIHAGVCVKAVGLIQHKLISLLTMADSLPDAAGSSSSTAYAAAGAAAAATAAASASSETSGEDNDNDDEKLARRLQALDQLTNIFGFTMEIAQEAVDAVGFPSYDINVCYNYILDNFAAEAKDSGGPITPIDSCPHIQNHVKLSLEQLNAIQPHATTCQYHVTSTSSASAVGRFKSELKDDGNCPGTENWLCLECGLIGCSRYVNGHGMLHWEQTKKVAAEEAAAAASSSSAGSSSNNIDHANHAENIVVDTSGHCVAVSLADLSVWCYVCNAYLRHPSLSVITQKLEELKFFDDDDTATPTMMTTTGCTVATTAAATAAASAAAPSIAAAATATAAIVVKEPERKKARQQQNDDQEIGGNDEDDDNDDADEDNENDEDDGDADHSGRSPAFGMECE
jgi:Zn-finger in ubiquitin-hydrolases and other protein